VAIFCREASAWIRHSKGLLIECMDIRKTDANAAFELFVVAAPLAY